MSADQQAEAGSGEQPAQNTSNDPSENPGQQPVQTSPPDPNKDAENRNRLEKSIAAAQKVVATQKQAESLKQRALNAINPKERIRLLKESYQKEVEAHGQSKYAKRLQSGLWQGGTAGGGIGAGVAMGVGAVTGTLVSGLVSVPTVLLGGLVGVAAGGIHGPWFTLPGTGGGKKGEAMSESEMREKAMKEAEALDQAVEKGATTVPQPPPEITESERDVVGEDEKEIVEGAEDGMETPVSERKKPRKLQVRSASQQASPTPERKKPRKLEVRSGGQSAVNA